MKIITIMYEMHARQEIETKTNTQQFAFMRNPKKLNF
jgi:hypothetical protein